jgi:hypothetical protein
MQEEQNILKNVQFVRKIENPVEQPPQGVVVVIGLAD